MKTVWMTSLVASQDKVTPLLGQLKTYGLNVQGHFWDDNLEKMSWIQAREELIKPEVAMWIIFAPDESLQSPTVRYGLSLLAITVSAKKGLSFPTFILGDKSDMLSEEHLPTSLKGAEVLSITDAAMAAKIVSKMHSPGKEIISEYRLDVYGNLQIGQWFEIGPQNSAWAGAMFGVAGAEILFHAVGPKGMLPSHSVLNYPAKGMKIGFGEREYTAWAVQNEIDAQHSYYIKVQGFPESVIFGQYAPDQEAEVFVVVTK